MTDTSSLIATHPAPQPHPVTVPSLGSPLVNGSLSDTNLPEEEDYTIKCICAYEDDDGNTVYCPKCESWQHIECYYHGKKVPEVHLCADCYPRELDAKRATERQKRVREAIEGGDRKIKRPTSKGHKKKTKESIATTDQVNGWHTHERHDSLLNGRDQPPPAKKPKTSHRPSGSIISLNGTENRKRAPSNVQSYPSPSKSPQELFRFPSVPTYTSDFLELYDRDEGRMNVSDEGENVYTIPASNKLSAYRADSSVPANEKGRTSNLESPLIHSDLPLDPTIWPEVSLEVAKKTDVDYDGRYPSWHLLRIQTDVKKDQLVGVIRGQVGLLEDYCAQGLSSNRWQELHHPDPFVFFHPHMNIYIDSRREGTKFRYVRRSCRPNVTLKTLVSKDGNYHHCFMASKPVQAGTELTAAWYLFPGLFKGLINVDPVKEDEELQSRRIAWTSHVLANFGDCACDRQQPCLLAQLDRRYSPKSLELPTKQSTSRKKKTKNKHAISPLSTGQATNSRAGSEIKAQDDDDPFDHGSTSGSSQSRPQSRDITPVNVGMLDENPVLGSALSARERRKIAAAEKAFERVEQGQQPVKKKKRTSGGSTLNTPTANSSHYLGNSYPSTPSILQPSYADLRASRPFSGSPPPLRPPKSQYPSDDSPCRPTQNAQSNSGHSSGLGPHKPTYVHASVQTEPEEPDKPIMPRLNKRKFSTPTQRLLKKILADRERYEQQQKHKKVAGDVQAPFVSNNIENGEQVQAVQGTYSEDIEMKDAATSVISTPAQSPVDINSPLESPKTNGDTSSISPKFPLPSQAAHSQKSIAPSLGPRLHLSTLPPVPSFPGGTNANNPTLTTPTTMVSTPGAVQSPFGFGTGSNSYPGLSANNIAGPSPAKKKLSLGDYMSRKNLAPTPVIEKTQAQANAPAGDVSSLPDSVNQAFPPAADPHQQANVMVKPNDSIREEAAAMSAGDESAIDDTPMKEEPDYSPPGASPVDIQPTPAAPPWQEGLKSPQTANMVLEAEETPGASTQQPSAGNSWVGGQGGPPSQAKIAPEVEEALAKLRELTALHGKQRSQSASSST